MDEYELPSEIERQIGRQDRKTVSLDVLLDMESKIMPEERADSQIVLEDGIIGDPQNRINQDILEDDETSRLDYGVSETDNDYNELNFDAR